MKTRLNYLAGLCLTVMMLAGAGCDNSGESNFVEQYVLDGFMPLGQPLRIRLTKSVDIDNYYDGQALGVAGAQVVIRESLNGDTAEYALVADTTGPVGNYIATTPSAIARSGYSYSLRVDLDGQVITARTSPAPPPVRLDSCYNGSAKVESFADSTDPETYEYREGNYYGLFFSMDAGAAGINFFIENLEPDWYSNEDRGVSGHNGPDQSNVWAWTIRDGNYFAVPPVVLGFQGRHRVRAMTCDSAAYDYFLTLFPGDPNSNPTTNVTGALGLFSVYDADTAYFCMMDPEADVHDWCDR
ncbi:DUF4249 family protein [candidate division KSB1 bacterium]|nr:DUF4249 family protein [candidate division KSB1 bacterium]